MSRCAAGRVASEGSTAGEKKEAGLAQPDNRGSHLIYFCLCVRGKAVLNAGRRAHSEAHGALQRGVLFGLAADVVEGEQQVVVVCQVGRNLHLHLLVELGRPSGVRRRASELKKGTQLDGRQAQGGGEGQSYLLW